MVSMSTFLQRRTRERAERVRERAREEWWSSSVHNRRAGAHVGTEQGGRRMVLMHGGRKGIRWSKWRASTRPPWVLFFSIFRVYSA
jgi:hypothetical protein